MRPWQKFFGVRPVLLAAALIFGSVGCGTEPPGSHLASAAGAGGDFAGPVEIGNGRHLYLECRGRGSPTIILESGYHNAADAWGKAVAVAPAVGPALLNALSDEHRVCAYDRPGTLRYSDPPTISDRSSPVGMPRSAGDVVGDLHALLDAAHLPGPFVLVGHSLGGLFIRLYAQTHPEQVRGLVFVDAFGAEIPALLGSDWPAYRQALDGPPPRFANSPSFEIVDIDRSVEQVAEAPAFPPVPTAVLTRTEPFTVPADLPAEKSAKLEQVWRDAASALIALRPETPHLLATGSDHFIQMQQPDLVAAAVELVIRRSSQTR